MIKKLQIFIAFFIILLSNPALSAISERYNSNCRINTSRIIRNAKGLKSKILSLAVKAYKKAKAKGLTNKDIITIVDYTLPSKQPRMWVIDLKKGVVKQALRVAHGKGSGRYNAHSFSNIPGSHQSSLGLFLTGQTYLGAHGESLHLHGLEQGINNNAYKRHIVVHSAGYASDNFVEQNGRLGNSYGCLAVNKKYLKKLVHTIKDGTLIFSYYPKKSWLNKSKFL